LIGPCFNYLGEGFNAPFGIILFFTNLGVPSVSGSPLIDDLGVYLIDFTDGG
jgi:hypothetical protein